MLIDAAKKGEYKSLEDFLKDYDELLEFYKIKGYVSDCEYEKLKSNYDVLEYCDYDDYLNSNISYYDQNNELKLKLNEKDVLLKKYEDELKEKDRIIQQLESFRDEYKDKEIEKLKSSNNELNTINTSLNTKINELENSNNDLNKIIAELKAKINELEDNKNNEIENLKNECKLALNNKHTIFELRKLINRCKKLGFNINTDKQITEYKMKELEKLLTRFIETF